MNEQMTNSAKINEKKLNIVGWDKYHNFAIPSTLFVDWQQQQQKKGKK